MNLTRLTRACVVELSIAHCKPSLTSATTTNC